MNTFAVRVTPTVIEITEKISDPSKFPVETIMTNDPDYCFDCKKEIPFYSTDYYMVTDELWAQYGVGKDLLCWSCIEMRMGRPIAASDLNDSMLNRKINSRSMDLLYANKSDDNVFIIGARNNPGTNA